MVSISTQFKILSMNKTKKFLVSITISGTAIFLLWLSVITPSYGQVESCNVVWDSPSQDSWGSMPAGNGDIGANIWVDPEGEIHFYISKTDAFSGNGRLLKIGKLTVRFHPAILKDAHFRQELDLKSGTIRITGEKDGQKTELLFWVDANAPVITLEGRSSKPVRVEVEYAGWRRSRRELSGPELRSAYGLIGSPDPVIAEPDVVASVDDGLLWYHCNERSIWPLTLQVQALDSLAGVLTDPLLHRTFGAYVTGKGLVKKTDELLVSEKASREIGIHVFPYTARTATPDDWRSGLLRIAGSIEKADQQARKNAHEAWWRQFWERSYILVSSQKDPDKIYNVTRGYQLQRYLNACSGRGWAPVKFNGSIFTVDVLRPIRGYVGLDADFRDWGACYWWQNTRLPYWTMLYSGDFELMRPLFRMYMDALPLAKYRTEKYYKHPGAMYPETIYFWGTWNNNNYGWDREGKPDGLSDNHYIRYEWQGGIELVAMMLDRYAFAPDSAFLNDTLVPFAREILTFYDRHYPRDKNGKIRLDPAQSLETYWEGTVNPLPEIAGLRWVVNGLLGYEDILRDESLIKLCLKLQEKLPGLPMSGEGDDRMLLPAESFGKTHNVENPELYAVFPYRIYGVGKPDVEVARRTYARRKFKDYRGWQQDGIQAALLGLTGEASRIVTDNFNTKHEGSRFPAFWGPNYDWVPDQDHGTVNMRALQNMLVQTDGGKILLFPAWPQEWDVKFKVHAPGNTVIEGELSHGSLTRLKVMPESRRKDVVNCLESLGKQE